MLLNDRWDGIIWYFEAYLASNSYNREAQILLQNSLSDTMPRFYLAARKDLNHFVFQSMKIDGFGVRH